MLRAYKAKHDSGIYRLKEYEELRQINVLCDSSGFSSEKETRPQRILMTSTEKKNGRRMIG